jgi:glycosyltransferase involved in cell wall biosynthesis
MKAKASIVTGKRGCLKSDAGRKMKLLQIGASWLSYQFSGLERYYAELVIHLPSLGTEVTGLVYELKEAPKVEGLKLISFGTQNKSPARKFLDQRRILKRYLNNGIDVVVSHCTPSLFPSLNDLGGKPLICHFHGPRYLERTVEGANPLAIQLLKYIEHKVYARADHIITLSHYMKDVLEETYGYPGERISVVPGGVNVDQFKQCLTREEARKRLELPVDRPIILTVRRLDRRMGLRNLIEAMSEVSRINPDVLLLIAGKGMLQDELDRDIRSRSLSANIRMMGAVADRLLPLLYKAADFSIVPTTAYEGFGLILVESLASGTPVLGTPVGAIPEVLSPLAESLLLESASPEHLSQGICEVLSGRRVLPSARECENYAVMNYAWPFVAAKVHATYRDVLAENEFQHS